MNVSEEEDEISVPLFASSQLLKGKRIPLTDRVLIPIIVDMVRTAAAVHNEPMNVAI